MASTTMVALCLALIATTIGQTVLFVMVPVIGEITKIGLGGISLAITAGIFAFTIAAPMWGRISDSIGRRKVMLFGCAGVVLGHGGVALTVEMAARDLAEPDLSLVFLTAFRLVHGVSAAALMPIAQAWVADIHDESAHLSKFGVLRLSMTAGRLAGPPLAAVLMLLAPLTPIYFLCVFALAAFFLVSMCSDPEKRRTAEQSSSGSSTTVAVPLLLAVVVLLSLMVGQLQFTMGPHVQVRLGLDAVHASQFVGLLLTAAALAALAVQVFVVKHLRDCALGTLVASSMIASGAVVLVFWGEARLLFVLGAIFAGTAMAAALPACAALISVSAARDRLGRVMGAFGSAQTIGYAIGAALGGLYDIAPMVSFGFSFCAPFMALLVTCIFATTKNPLCKI
ncbi:MFS transporter [Pelagibius sp. Alg239-R121]|uniref:MFS transporter n=1 Tax=Pelagibius sp. Alg239-R121 TaxID=2993448 RepID=UPI0024A6E76D|nr:MFS transporter [Pelagibius sp. Alg239-R121]